MGTEGESRFNLKRIQYALEAQIVPFHRDGVPGYYLKTSDKEPDSPSSLLGWTDASITAQADIPGEAKLTVEQGAVVFTAPGTGASISYYPDGSLQYAASVDSPLAARERLRREQAHLDWWDRSPEIMKDEYVTETGLVVARPDGGTSTRKGTPYRHFKLAIPLSETEARTFDVYAYEHWVGLVDSRKLKPEDRVRVRASVQYHEQKQPGGKSLLVPWLRLFDVRRIP